MADSGICVGGYAILCLADLGLDSGSIVLASEKEFWRGFFQYRGREGADRNSISYELERSSVGERNILNVSFIAYSFGSVPESIHDPF